MYTITNESKYKCFLIKLTHKSHSVQLDCINKLKNRQKRNNNNKNFRNNNFYDAFIKFYYVYTIEDYLFLITLYYS